MEEIRGRIRDDLHARLIGHGARDDFAERAIFDEVDRVFAQALAHDDARALLLPARLEEPWRPTLSLDFPGHRGRLAAGAIRFAKSRLVLPVVRWLFEYAQENFRRQHHLNVVLMATVQTLAADQARLKARLAELERRAAMKLLLVVQRYGPEVTGGSEALCRAIAQRLAERHDVSVATSCATDYVTWANVLPPGTSSDGRVTVHRFESARQRPLQAFWRLSDRIFDDQASAEEQAQWFALNGPDVPGLLDVRAGARPRLRPRPLLHVSLCAVVVRAAAGRRPRHPRADRGARSADPLEHDPRAVLPAAARLPVPDAGGGSDGRQRRARRAAAVGGDRVRHRSGAGSAVARRARRARRAAGFPRLSSVAWIATRAATRWSGTTRPTWRPRQPARRRCR